MTTTRPSSPSPSDLAADHQKDWPTMYDLPSEDPQEPGLPDEFHDLQPQLLSATLRLSTVARDQVFTGSDLNLYYDLNYPTWYKRPDWFAVVGVSRLYGGSDLRMSYVTWDEQVNPFIVVELISPGTAMEDLAETQRRQDGTPTKWQVYEQILKIPYYVVFDRYKEKLWFFKWTDGQYQELDVSPSRLWIPEQQVGLGLWQGEYSGINRPWLRWYDASENWILTDSERERQRADRLAEQLRALGVEPEE